MEIDKSLTSGSYTIYLKLSIFRTIMRKFFFVLSLLVFVFRQQQVQAQNPMVVNSRIYDDMRTMVYTDFYRYCDSLLLLYPNLTYDILTYRLKSSYSESNLTDAVSDLRTMRLHPTKKSYSKVDVSRIVAVLEPFADDYWLGLDYFNAGAYKESAVMMHIVHENCVFFWQSHFILTQCYDSLKMSDSALDAVEYGIQQTASPHLYALLVQKNFDRANYSSALADASFLIRENYSDAQLFFLRSKIYFLQNQIPKALEDMQVANMLSPGNPHYLVHNACLYCYSSEIDLAYRLFTNAIKKKVPIAPKEAEILLDCALSRPEAGSDEINYLLSLYADNLFLYKVILTSSYGSNDTLLHYLDEAISKYPKEVSLYEQRATLRRKINHNDPLVKKDYYTLIDLETETIHWYKKLHTHLIYNDAKEAGVVRQRAKDEMHRLLLKDSLNAQRWFHLAEAYNLLDYMRENPSIKRKAISYYSKAIELDSTCYQAFYERANLQKLVNKNNSAYLSDMRRALALRENGHYRHAISYELYMQSKYDEAIEEINKAILLYPDMIALYEARSTYYTANGNKDLANKDEEMIQRLYQKQLANELPPPPPPIDF